MNSNQFKKLIAILLLVGGIALLFLSRDQKVWQESERALGGKVIPEFPLNDVKSITLKDADNEITIAKVDEIWTVGARWNYPADFSKVGDLIQDVWDLKVTRKIKAGPSQYGRLGLVSPGEGTNSGILLTFGTKDKPKVASLLLGKKPSQPGGGGEFPNGRYVLPNDNGEAIALVSETFSSVDADAKHWLDKDFFKVEKLKSAEVTHPETADSWSISRDSDTSDMTLAGLDEKEELDSTKTYSLKNILSSPSFNDVIAPSASDEETGMDKPIVATLKTFEDFDYTIKVGKANSDDNYPIKLSVTATIPTEREAPENESEEDKERLDKEFKEKNDKLKEKLETEQAYQKWTYLVSKWTVDTLLNKRSDLVKEKEKETEDTADATGEIGPPTPVIPSTGENPEITPESETTTESEDASEEVAEDVEAVIDAVINPVPAPNK
ncbi:MAG: hypothetical protein M2R45_01886 [Verrucomicrobia subdivision 3 bacterium]|nr:hypothetical protein [Limisphaerales bacterium]MCS1415686.1 hypothetical protein [Limisphaerales bacterium]